MNYNNLIYLLYRIKVSKNDKFFNYVELNRVIIVKFVQYAELR